MTQRRESRAMRELRERAEPVLIVVCEVGLSHAPSGGLLQLGSLRASPDPSDPSDPTTATAALLEHAVWRSEVTRGGAWVELNLP